MHCFFLLIVLVLNACTPGAQEHKPRVFPPGFLWGTATAAHQVEGNLINDMTQWEDVAPDAAGKCRIFNCDKSRSPTPAADWGGGRYDEDFVRAQSLGNNTIRVSFEWARIEPAPGQISTTGVKFYHDMLANMNRHGLKPMVTVNHFTLPVWIQSIQDEGGGRYATAATAGWRDANLAPKLASFAAFLAREYGAEVDYWCTINEPWSVLLGGYLTAVIPPARGNPVPDFEGMLEALENMLRAHAAMYHAIKENDQVDADGDGQTSWVGIVRHDRLPVPMRPDNEKDRAAAKNVNYIFTDIFNEAVVTGKADLRDAGGGIGFDHVAETIIDPRADSSGYAGTTDFWGLNYYGAIVLDSSLPLPFVGAMPVLDARKVKDLEGKPRYPVSDLGWAIYPAGFRERLNYYWKKWGRVQGRVRPIIVTENGVADQQDAMRAQFIVDHLDAMLTAIVEDGVDVRGYYHWSLMDNFEWAEGYAARFGLFRMDAATQVRTETEGARAYQAVIEANTVNENHRNRWSNKPYAAPKFVH